LPTIAAVLVAVVLGGNLEMFPAEIEERDRPVAVADG
jgi:hypothetical protein